MHSGFFQKLPYITVKQMQSNNIKTHGGNYNMRIVVKKTCKLR